MILTGRGGNFSSGMNLHSDRVLNPAEYSIQELRRFAVLGSKMCQAWESIEALTISAIEGVCIGAGVALSLSMDLRVCANDSTMYVPEIERGMSMGWQSVPRSVALIGPARTKRMFMLAEKISATQAAQWGWADYLSAPGAAVEFAKEIAGNASKMPQIPMRMCKQSINVAANALNHAVSYMDADQLVLTLQTKDYYESIQSFLSKRKPNYTGD